MMGALNVLPIPYFCALGTGLNVSGKVNYDLLNIWMFIIAAMLGTFTTLYLYVISSVKVTKKTADINKYTNYFMAWLMMLLLVITPTSRIIFRTIIILSKGCIEIIF